MAAIVDLRSDTVTLPTEAMLDAMRAAPLGDDGLDGDPTVRQLEELAASITGKDGAIFVTSGTMGNLVATLVHAARGGEALMDDGAHIAKAEAGGISRLAGLLCTLIPSTDGEMNLDALSGALRTGFTRSNLPTAMVVVETTHNRSGGSVPTLAYMGELQTLAQHAGAAVHIDGARVFNAARALGVGVAEIASRADSMTFCLSKGLSAPMGSMLVGSHDFINRARTFRRMVGGGLRQAGCVAAAGVLALNEMVGRLGEDHKRATDLWQGLRALSPSLVSEHAPQTNIVMLSIPQGDAALGADQWIAELLQRGVKVRARDSATLRFVLHRHITDDDVWTALEAIRDCLASQGAERASQPA